MTVVITLLSFAVAILMIMIYAGQCYIGDLADKITDLENDLKDHKTAIISLEGKTDRLMRRIKEMEEER